MKAEIIAAEDWEEALTEIGNEVKTAYPQDVTPVQKKALGCFFITMCKITASIFDWLPPEERSQVLTSCGTWFCLGMLFGKSPELLVKILNKVNPTIDKEEIPEWLVTFIKRAILYGQ